MKHWSVLLAIITAIGLIIGGGSCNNDNPTSSVEAPANVTVSAAANGTDLVVAWDASPTEGTTDGITGYYVYFKGGSTPVATVASGTHTATVTTTGVGLVEVSAYRDTMESSKASFTIAPYTGSLVIYGASISGQNSGWGWNTNGGGSSYSLIEANKEDINFWFDDASIFSTGYELYGCDVLGPSPHNWSSPFNDFAIVTGPNYDTMTQAPATGSYDSYTEMVDGQAYYVYIKYIGSSDNYFLKMKVTSYNSTTQELHIDYTYQKVKNLRRLGG